MRQDDDDLFGDAPSRRLQVGTAVKESRLKSAWEPAAGEDPEAWLAERGIKPPKKPNFDYPGALTGEELSNKTERDYTDLYAKHQAWHTYTAVLVASTKSAILGLENARDDLATETRLEYRRQNAGAPKGKGNSEKAIEDQLFQNVSYKKLSRELQIWQQRKLMADAWLDGMHRALMLLSRQVEMRRNDIERSAGTTAIGGRAGERPRRF